MKPTTIKFQMNTAKAIVFAGILTSLAMSGSAQEQKLFAHWSFDSTDNATSYFDMTGNGYTAVGDKMMRSAGIRNKALDCNDQTFEVLVPKSGTDFNIDKFTIEGWIFSYIDLSNPGSFYNFRSIFNYVRVGMEGSGVTGGYNLQVTDKGRLMTSMSSAGGGSWHVCESDEVLQPRTWYHVAATYDQSTLRLYLNGRLENETAAPGGYLAPQNIPARIGAQFQVTDTASNTGRIRNRFQGKIDELKIYNYALSPQSLKAAYDLLKPADKPPFEINLGMKTTYAQPGEKVTVPVYIANHEEYDISALQLTLNYDPAKLVLLTVNKDSGVVKTFEMFNWNAATAGSVPVAMAGSTVRFGYGEGELFRCEFAVAPSAVKGDTCMVHLNNVVIDETNKLIVSTTQSGRIIVTKSTMLYGDITGNDQVTVVDAQQVLQYVVGALSLPDVLCCPNFTTAVADASGNGSVTSYDAALIFQYCIGLIPVFPVESSSIRLPAKRVAVSVQKASLSFVVNNEIHDALVYDLVGANLSGFYAGEFAIHCDAPADLLSKSTITTGVKGAILSSRYSADDHLLRVALSSNDDIDHDDPVAIIRIALPPAQQSTTNFSVKTALVNEGAITTDFDNGGLVGLLPAKTAPVRPADDIRMSGSLLAIHRAAASTAATVTVWDLCGRTIARRIVDGTGATIDFGKFGKGTYIVRLHDGMSSVTGRVVLIDR